MKGDSKIQAIFCRVAGPCAAFWAVSFFWAGNAWAGETSSWNQEWMRLLVSSGKSPLVDLIMIWTSRAAPLVPVLAAALWLGIFQGARGRWWLLGLGGLILWTDMVLGVYIRPWLASPRPYAEMADLRVFIDGAWLQTSQEWMKIQVHAYGLPSAHASNAMGPAVYLYCYHKKTALLLFALAMLVGWSRIHLGVHYPADVLAGMLWGGFWGLALGLLLRRLVGPGGAASAQ